MKSSSFIQKLEKEQEALLKRKFELSVDEVKALSDIQSLIEDYKAGLVSPRELRRKLESSFCRIGLDQVVVCNVCREEIEDESYEMMPELESKELNPICQKCLKEARETDFSDYLND